MFMALSICAWISIFPKLAFTRQGPLVRSQYRPPFRTKTSFDFLSFYFFHLGQFAKLPMEGWPRSRPFARGPPPYTIVDMCVSYRIQCCGVRDPPLGHVRYVAYESQRLERPGAHSRTDRLRSGISRVLRAIGPGRLPAPLRRDKGHSGCGYQTCG